MNTNINSNITEEMLQEVKDSNLSECLKSLLVAAIANSVAGSRHCYERLGNTQAVYNALSKANCPLTALEIAESISPYASSQFVNAHMKKLRVAGCEIVKGKPRRYRGHGFHAFLNINVSEETLEKLCVYFDRNKENDKIYHGMSLKELLNMCGDEIVTFYPNYVKYNTYTLRK